MISFRTTCLNSLCSQTSSRSPFFGLAERIDRRELGEIAYRDDAHPAPRGGRFTHSARDVSAALSVGPESIETSSITNVSVSLSLLASAFVFDRALNRGGDSTFEDPQAKEAVKSASPTRIAAAPVLARIGISWSLASRKYCLRRKLLPVPAAPVRKILSWLSRFREPPLFSVERHFRQFHE